MGEFIVTLLFGWLGVHKFMQKKYLMGVLYLFTLGLCGFGWAIDTAIAFINMIRGKRTFARGGTACPPTNKQLVKSFDTVIVGTFAKCALDKDYMREDLISCVKPKWELSLKHWEYKGEPAYYVLHPNGVDLGCVRAGLAKILYEEYNDCEMKVYAIEKGYDERNDCLTYNIRIDIYN